MSAIFGISNFDGAQVNDGHLRKMLIKSAGYGLDGQSFYIGEHMGLGCCMSRFGVFSRADTPIYHDETGESILVCDALLWNRLELVKALDLEPTASTQKLIMESYRRWGGDCPKYINGDFSFVIWNKTENQLFIARDHLGVRPLYYCYSGSLFAFATDYRALLCLPFVGRQLDEVKLYALCTGTYHIEPERTYFQQIKKLPMAHTLLVGANGMQTKQYWSPGRGKKTTFATEAEYKQALYTVVNDAVRLRVNGVSGNVGTELSGGLDSSVITTLANRELKKHNRALAGAFSWSPPSGAVAVQKDDERKQIHAVCKAEGLQCAYLDLRKNDQESTVEGCLLTDGGRGAPFRRELPYLGEQGAKFVLSGWGGDQGISHRANLKEFFFNGLWRPFFREARYAANGSGLRLAKVVVSNTVVRLFGPFSIFDNSRKNMPEIVRYDWKRKMKRRCRRDILYFTIDPVKHIESGNIQTRTELTAWVDAQYNMQHLFPFLDFHVMDFAMSIPREWYYKNGCSRYIFRKAFEGILSSGLMQYNQKNDPAIMALSGEMKVKNFENARTEGNKLDEKLFSPYIDLQKLRKATGSENREEVLRWAGIIVRKCYEIQQMLVDADGME